MIPTSFTRRYHYCFYWINGELHRLLNFYQSYTKIVITTSIIKKLETLNCLAIEKNTSPQSLYFPVIMVCLAQLECATHALEMVLNDIPTQY